MTSQQSADLALAQWQALRALPPDARIESLMASYFLPPSETDLEYDLTMKRVTEEMGSAL
jgi:hypothetical protein